MKLIRLGLTALATSLLTSVANADVIASNLQLPSSGIAPALGRGTQLAAGITTGSRRERFARFTAELGSGSGATITGGIYANVSGSPGAQLVAFKPVVVPAATSNAEVEFVTETVFDLEPDRTYWIVLESESLCRWATADPATLPTTAPGVTFAGYRSSTSGGASWLVSEFTRILAIETAPEATLSNLPADAFEVGPVLSLVQFDAVGLTTGDMPAPFTRMTATLSNLSPTQPELVFGGIHADDGGEPGEELVALSAATIPPARSNVEVTFEAARPFVLDPNTTYWFVLKGTGLAATELRRLVPTPSALPRVVPGVAFAGYKTSRAAGTSWVDSDLVPGVDIELGPKPLMTNLSAGLGFGSQLAGIRLLAVGFTTGAESLERPTATAIMLNDASEALELRATLHTDSGGDPGARVTTFRPVMIPGDTPSMAVNLVVMNPSFTLEAGTSYWLVLDSPNVPADGVVRWITSDPATDPTPAAGISFDGYRVLEPGDTAWRDHGFAPKLVSVSARSLATAACPADCDGSGSLDIFDFLCFQNAFDAGEAKADCDGSGALDIFDFLCFQNSFDAGCP